MTSKAHRRPKRRAPRRAAWITAAVSAALAAVAYPASASQPTTATGTFVFVSDSVTPIRAADGNVFLREAASIGYSGDLTGVVTATDMIVAHGDGSFNGHGTETCSSCTIGDRTGSFTAEFTFTGSAGQFRGTYTFTKAGGGLAGLHGQGTFHGDFTSNIYAYDYHFES